MRRNAIWCVMCVMVLSFFVTDVFAASVADPTVQIWEFCKTILSGGIARTIAACVLLGGALFLPTQMKAYFLWAVLGVIILASLIGIVNWLFTSFGGTDLSAS